MTIVSIECGRCEALAEVPTGSLLLDVGDMAAGYADDGVGGAVSWICPACADVISQPVPWLMLVRLIAEGALLLDEGEDEGEEAQQPHPESPPEGPALSRDDVLDLHTVLESPGWFSALQATLGPLSARPTR